MYVKIGEVKVNRLSCGDKETLIHYQSFHDIYTEENGVPKIHNFKLKTKQAKNKKVEFDRQWSQAIDFLPGKLFVQKEAQQLPPTSDAKGPSRQKRR